MRSRLMVRDTIRGWAGLNEKDGSHKKIIDIYNNHNPKPRGLTMQPNWAWCACTWSAVAIDCGYTDIMPVEISCGELIKMAQKMGIWVERDDYIPEVGDGVLYDWDDSGKGDNTGWPDHIGIIDSVNREAGYFTVWEGNYNDSVKKRTVSLNGKYIRGFITPKYDSEHVTESIRKGQVSGKDIVTVAREVIAGQWRNGVERTSALKAAGYDPASVQNQVNIILNGGATMPKSPIQDQQQPVSKKVMANCSAKRFLNELAGTYTTTGNVYCRNDAGTNKKALCQIPKGTKVNCYGYFNLSGNTRWLYIQFKMDGVEYTGFTSVNYLKR